MQIKFFGAVRHGVIRPPGQWWACSIESWMSMSSSLIYIKAIAACAWYFAGVWLSIQKAACIPSHYLGMVPGRFSHAIELRCTATKGG
jgi:hypothetical protein